MNGTTLLLSIPVMIAIAFLTISFIRLCREARQDEMDQRVARERHARRKRP